MENKLFSLNKGAYGSDSVKENHVNGETPGVAAANASAANGRSEIRLSLRQLGSLLKGESAS